MKTITTILMLAMSLMINAQNASVSLLNVSPEELCPGQQTSISFSFNATPSGTFTIKMSFYNDQNQLTTISIFSGQMSDLSQNNIGYFVNYSIPANSEIGQHRFCSNGTTCYYIMVNDCQTTTGIPTYSADPIQLSAPIYFDITGRQVEKCFNQVLEERIYDKERLISSKKVLFWE